jgi:CheY-like chemotaxis protein
MTRDRPDPPKRTGPIKALVIDDDDIVRELMISLLREHGHMTFELPSPIGATRMLLREQIDVVILDVMMPGLSGDKLAKMLRSNPRLKRTAIVLVSSCNIGQLKELAERVDADAIVPKNETRKRLVDEVNRAVWARALKNETNHE